MSNFARAQRILSLAKVDLGTCEPSPTDPVCHSLLKKAAASARLYKDTDNAEVSQWLSLSRGLCEGTDKKSTLLTVLDSALQRSSFLLPSSVAFGLADLAVFDAVLQPKVAPECEAFAHVCRWARQMSGAVGVPLTFTLPPFVPTVFTVTAPATASASASSSCKGEPQDQKEGSKGPEDSKEKQEGKKEIPAMSEKQLAKQKEKTAKKEKAAKEKAAKDTPAAAKAGTGDDLDPSKLDFRVGLVQKCWPHPEAEKLLW